MKKLSIICLTILILIFATVAVFAKDDNQAPTKVKVLSQSCMENSLCLTVIDLSNNEIVILHYSFKPESLFKAKFELFDVIRTGMFVNPDEQGMVKGVDAPFKEDEKEDEKEERDKKNRKY
jgi:hypothetical protein